MSYPRKQTALIFVVCVSAIVFTAVYVQDQNLSKKMNNQVSRFVTPSDNRLGTSTDWKKTFFEVTGKSDDFKTTSSEGSTQSGELNDTDKLGRNFFTTFVQLRQAGLNSDPQALTNAATQLVSDTIASIPSPKIYLASEVKVSANADLQVYANNVSNILSRSMPVQNEAEIATAAFEKGDLSLLKDIEPIVSGYKKAVDSLLMLPVPAALSQDHLNLVNSLSTQIYSAEALRRADVDPVRGLAAIKLELVGLEGIYNAISNMQRYFVKNDVSFEVSSSFSGQ